MEKDATLGAGRRLFPTYSALSRSESEITSFPFSSRRDQAACAMTLFLKTHPSAGQQLNFIQKPFDSADFGRKVRELLHAHPVPA